MSQIKSYLSIDSVPSQEFRTPVKHTIQHMSTNNSLSFSNTMGSLDNKSSWNRRTLYRSNELDKDFGNQNRDYVEEQEQYMENNSSVTLNPVITQVDLYEFINSLKIVAFLSKENEDKKAIISNKQKVIKKLQSQIFLIEQRAKFQKRQFQKKEKAVKSRSLSMQKYKKQLNEKIHNDIIDMKLQIGRMRRTLSSQKASVDTRRVILTYEKKRSMPMDSNRSNQKIYVPIYSNRAYYYPHEPVYQRQPSISSYNPMAPPNSMRNNPIQLESSQCRSLIKENSIENNVMNSIKKTPNSMFPPAPLRNQEMPIKQINVMGLLQENFQTQQNLFPGISQPFLSFETHQNQQMVQAPNYEPPKLTLNQQSLHFSRNKIEKSSNNFDYFNDDFGDEELKEELLTSQKSKKSIKNLKQSSKSVNKWKKDNEDQEIVELLKESINLSEKKQSQKTQKAQEKRSEIGAKLVVTTINQQKIQMTHLEVSPAGNTRELSINNGSQVQILIQNSDEKKANDSKDSIKRFSAKNIDRANIANSQIGIILQDINDSSDQIALNIESKIQSPVRKNGLSLYKEVPKIEEVEDQFPKTPVDFKIINNLQPSFQSRYTITPREVAAVPMANSHGSSLSKEEESLNTPTLSRPPSLLQQEQEEDIINSIKLTGNSRHFPDPSASKLSKIVHEPVQEEEEQDFLGGIRLVAMSRISRQKNSQTSLKDSEMLENTSNEKKMTRSDLVPQIQQMNDDANGMDIIDSQLRKSTNSVIIKKGSSAIQRSVNRKQPNQMKQSNRGSTLSGKSNELSTPIEEAEEEQEEVSHIVKRHIRNLTDIPS